ncbi:Uncharacterized protein YtpQ, UPF0354 family [Marinococcus luteus]|uniref:Uncharacterized protein YtpQ, UPF0354 family n=1 Tax=Marinococcus luteus TaxID=1122204 RepID=A0A1H2Y8I9_9BACI|nr:DUF1444 family protein [Marinococcus luteus]SDX01533.1 Uncharacterized protein YtpQ, UPF0354 family [Marinococcus luteus]
MEVRKLQRILRERLKDDNSRTFKYDDEQSSLRVEHKQLKTGVDLDLSKWAAKYEREGEKAVEEVVHYIDTSFRAMERDVSLSGQEQYIYPVIRSTSFPTETKDGKELVWDDHTAETRIFYALDMGEAYSLIEQDTLEAEQIETENIRRAARNNVKKLEVPMKKDTVAGNTFYFINTNDGYDASRILNEALLQSLAEDVQGDMAVAVPHNDVFIIADITNDNGYDVLGQMAFRFFNDGRVPITALPFMYENGEFEPIFILAKKRPKT